MTGLSCVWDGKAELGEGVFWHEADQAVYWVDIMQSNLHRLVADGHTDCWHFPGQISAVVPCEGGGLLATFENGLSHIDLDTALVTTLITLETELPDNRFNDGCSDTRGQFWFGSMDGNQQEASGSFYRMDRCGDIEQLQTFGQVCITNGPAFSADGQWIYFTHSMEKKVYRAPLTKDGRAGTPQLHLQFGERDGFPDGMCTDTDGGLWICHFAGSRITRFLDNGEVDYIIDMPVPNITKCAFGGPDLRTLYIITAATSLNAAQREKYPQSGGLFVIDLPFRGVAMATVARPRAAAHPAQ